LRTKHNIKPNTLYQFKMKSVAAIALACLLANASAFTTPSFATRAVGNPFKKAKKPEPKKAAPKAARGNPFKKAKKPEPKAAPVSSKKAPPSSKGYPMIDTSSIKFNVSGGGNKGPGNTYSPFSFADQRLQIERDPEFYAAAAKTRQSAFTGNNDYSYDDGLTVIERDQRARIPGFLSGAARSQADVSTIRDDLVGDTLIFGLDPDRFQLLFITIFGIFTLVGCLSGNLNL